MKYLYAKILFAIALFSGLVNLWQLFGMDKEKIVFLVWWNMGMLGLIILLNLFNAAQIFSDMVNREFKDWFIRLGFWVWSMLLVLFVSGSVARYV